jgi:hypothetical protein
LTAASVVADFLNAFGSRLFERPNMASSNRVTFGESSDE